MDYFNYKNNQLFCEEVALSDLAEKYGTPAYVYSKKTLVRHLSAYSNSFEKLNNMICFSVKSLGNIAILNLLNSQGAGFDIVSGGELFRALKAGADPKKIIFSGVGKSSVEIAAGIKAGILSFNIESISEYERIKKIANEMQISAPISIRFNPDIHAGGHDYISTGRKEDKFGIDSEEQVLELAQKINEEEYLAFKGLACHIGSQILSLDGFEKAAIKTLKLCDNLNNNGINVTLVDLGGGLGVPYKEEVPPSPKELIQIIEKVFIGRNEQIILEPGRSISANSGILITKVEYIKNKFIIADAAMNDLLRPALYQAHHAVIPVIKNKEANDMEYDLVGPICETGDYLAKNIKINAEEGDLLAVKTAGAYGFVMSSNYNARPRAPEILVDGSNHHLIRRRETLEDLINLEEIP
ncbi:MAG: diaminopimelate decarboxylase, partial [Gammaproteobacteria bacterium]